MAKIFTESVASGWQWTVYADYRADHWSTADTIRGGWAPTPTAAKQRAHDALAEMEGE